MCMQKAQGSNVKAPGPVFFFRRGLIVFFLRLYFLAKKIFRTKKEFCTKKYSAL